MGKIRDEINENNYDLVSIHNGAIYLANSNTDGINRIIFWLKDIQKIESKKVVPHGNSPKVMYAILVSGDYYGITGEVFNTIMSEMIGGKKVEKKPDSKDDLYKYVGLLNDWIEATDSERINIQNKTNCIHNWLQLDTRWYEFANKNHNFEHINIPMCSRTQLAAELIRVRGLIEHE